MDTSLSDDNGARAPPVVFMVATLIIEVVFRQFLICAAV